MPRFAEFFAGIGLVREAIEPLGWECVFANDIAPAKAEMYEARFGSQHLKVEDIHELRLPDIPEDLDLLTASFPCIDLSLAGNRNGLAGRHSGTIWPFLDLVGEISMRRSTPAALLLENVTGLLSSDGGQDLRAICERMGSLGYLMDTVVVDARWFVPQSRPRLFVVAVRGDLVERAFPPTGEISRIRPQNVRRFQLANSDLPLVEFPFPDPPRGSRATLASTLQDVPHDDPSWWPSERVASLVKAMAPAHRERVDALLGGEQDGVATMFRRVRKGRTVGEVRGDRIAGCLRTPYGGSSVQFLVDCRSGMPRVRPLNGREYARLQGAGDFPLHVGNRQAFLGFGDAVCVPAVRWLVRHSLGFITESGSKANGAQLRMHDREVAYVAGA
ncbi:MAG: DNA (cytosine-5-)-methyltransferase [Chloroflexota bacterium]|nr:DNA (cytosine-5-)-methyltransferase [Chloroflexota bacterium]